jgi:hypothetical protein
MNVDSKREAEAGVLELPGKYPSQTKLFPKQKQRQKYTHTHNL